MGTEKNRKSMKVGNKQKANILPKKVFLDLGDSGNYIPGLKRTQVNTWNEFKKQVEGSKRALKRERLAIPLALADG